VTGLLGCIADDFSGASDVAAALRSGGWRVALVFGRPDCSLALEPVDAVVVALKSRSIPAAEAVGESLKTLHWLRSLGAQRYYFKYCSTFDSTDAGNIGPVTDALLAETGQRTTVICPASPEHGRTVYQGHLFVGSTLLSESPMRQHPLNPMTDANLVRLLARQTAAPVGLVPLDAVRAGAETLGQRISLLSDRFAHLVVDVTQEDDLDAVALATGEMPVVTGAAGLAGAIARTSRPEHGVEASGSTALPDGPAVALVGSCSAATLEQVAYAITQVPSYRLDPVATPTESEMVAQARAWLRTQLPAGPVMIYSSADAAARTAAIAAMGEQTATILERTLGDLGRYAVTLGARRIIAGGGETSGAVVQALNVRTVSVESELDQGVPWCLTPGESSLALILKSGNFGGPKLLVRALRGERDQ
jgi:3-dehydrotetronate 4-kinase